MEEAKSDKDENEAEMDGLDFNQLIARLGDEMDVPEVPDEEISNMQRNNFDSFNLMPDSSTDDVAKKALDLLGKLKESLLTVSLNLKRPEVTKKDMIERTLDSMNTLIAFYQMVIDPSQLSASEVPEKLQSVHGFLLKNKEAMNGHAFILATNYFFHTVLWKLFKTLTVYNEKALKSPKSAKKLRLSCHLCIYVSTSEKRNGDSGAECKMLRVH